MMFLYRTHLLLYDKFVYMMPFLLAIGIGITPAVVSLLSPLVTGFITVAALCLCTVFARVYTQIRYVAYAGMVVCVGTGVFVWKSVFVFADIWQGTPQQVTVQGTLKTVRYAPNKTQIRLQDVIVDGERIQGDIRLNVKGIPVAQDISLPYPKVVSLNARLYPPAPPIIPDAFDFRRFATYNGIAAFGKGVGDIAVIDSQSPAFAYRIAQHIYTHMSDRIGGVAIALISGNRVGIDADDVRALRGSGLAHLLAISGLHLGLVMGAVYLFIRSFCCLVTPQFFTAYPIKSYASVISLMVAFLYAMVADFPTPTVRAFSMGAIVVLGVLTHGKAFTIRSVSVVASAILLFTPESLFSVSFQLSFMAVLGLVAVFSYIRYNRGIWAMAYHVFVASTVAMLVTLPFSAYHFGTVAIYSVLANMIAVPMMAVAIVPLLMVSVFEYVLFGSGYSLYGVEFLLSVLLDWAYVIYDLPHSVYYTGHIPLWAVLGFVLAMVCAVYTGYKKTGISCMLIAIGVVLTYPDNRPDIIISRQGHIAIRHQQAYVIPTKNSFYFTDALRKQTGISTFIDNKCTRQCAINGVLYTPKNFVEHNPTCNRPEYRFIIAPNAVLRHCNTASFDKADRIINAYQGIKINIPQ